MGALKCQNPSAYMIFKKKPASFASKTIIFSRLTLLPVTYVMQLNRLLIVLKQKKYRSLILALVFGSLCYHTFIMGSSLKSIHMLRIKLVQENAIFLHTIINSMFSISESQSVLFLDADGKSRVTVACQSITTRGR